MELQLTIPLPPSLNNAYANRHGKRVLVTEGRKYKAQVSAIADSVANAIDWKYRGGELELTFHLVFSDKRRRDISNCVKLPEDAIAETLGFDDCRVKRLIVERGEPSKNDPRCEVTIKELSK